MPQIIEAKATSDSKVHLVFDNWREGDVDLSDIIGKGLFKKLRNPSFFRQAHACRFGALDWDGTLDMCPDALYERIGGIEKDMATISVFFGIIIEMYFNDHNPPHFHAWYGGSYAIIAIQTGKVVTGVLPKQALKLVREWQRKNKVALMCNWELARAGKPVKKIKPLD